MLKSLSIRNFVLIDKLDLDLQNGFTVFSGETGAGKSILLSSLGMLLGNRADVSMIRNGCDKLQINGVFDVKDKTDEIKTLLNEHGIDFEGEIIISRTLSKEGHNKIFVNDYAVTQKFLKELGAYLVEIHGQFDNQGLLDQRLHMKILDGYGDYGDVLKSMKDAYFSYKKAHQNRVEAEEKIKVFQLEEANLRHWVDEFLRIKPRENELNELEQKRQELMNAEKIIENFDTAYKSLNNQTENIHDCLRKAQAAIARVNGLTRDKYIGIYEVLDTALVNIEEANEQIENTLNEIGINNNDIDTVEERLFALKDLSRKHHVQIEELPKVWRLMEDKLAGLAHGEDDLINLRKIEKQAYDIYINKAKIVHEERVAAAEKLDYSVMKELPDLKMQKARFITDINVKSTENWDENGGDDIAFMVSTNPGTPFGPLNKIASGGEMARFMLALKVNLLNTSSIETMVFDEVDANIGGATAQAVGERLVKLGEKAQVFIVTHSPQVAAQSHKHYKVEKKMENGKTTTWLHLLNPVEKLEEIARMLSGEHISDEARAAAKVLIG